MKTICIYHSRDLDGWMSAAIVKKWWVENNTNYVLIDKNKNIIFDTKNSNADPKSLTFLGWDYGDMIPDLEKYDKIIMCDISFPKEGILKLTKEKQSNFIWIDHHQRIIDETIKYLYNNKLTEPSGLRTKEWQLEAACELTWDYFFPDEEMPEIVRLLGMYDSFRHKGTDEEQKVLEFQYGARASMINYEDCFDFLNYNIEDKQLEYQKFSIIDDLLNKGKTIYEYLKQEGKQIHDKAFEIILNERCNQQDDRNYYKFLCVNQERFNPINFGIDYHKKGYDGFACFWYNKSKWNFSLYNDNGNVDCSVIAKQYGGGGHKGAAGFICDNETILKIINNK